MTLRYAWQLFLGCWLGMMNWAQAQPGRMAAGNAHILTIHADGTLWACGYNADGRLGDGSTSTRSRPVQVGSSTAWHTVSTSGQAESASDPQFAPSPSFVLALQNDGSLWSWGYPLGALGYLSGTAVTSPRLVSAGPWVCASAGYNHSAAVKADGTLWTWGNNTSGQLGDGGIITNRSLPTQVDADNDWASVSAGYLYTLALKRNGTLWAWGPYGNLGIYSLGGANSYTPMQVGTATDWVRICAGGFSLALRSDGTLWGWGGNQNNVLSPQFYTAINLPQQLSSDTTWRSISGGAAHVVATKADGTLWSWGNNMYGQLGQNSTVSTSMHTQVGTATTW